MHRSFSVTRLHAVCACAESLSRARIVTPPILIIHVSVFVRMRRHIEVQRGEAVAVWVCWVSL